MKKILIVEDNPELQRLYTRVLEGCKLYYAKTVSEAQFILTKEPIDLILLDYHLPGQSGLELLQHLKDTADMVGVFIVSADMQIFYKANNFKVDAWFMKPIDVLEFRERVEHYLRQ